MLPIVRMMSGVCLSLVMISGPLSASESLIELATHNGCFLCHSIDSRNGEDKPLAPTYRAIAERYAERKDAFDYLTNRVLHGTAYSEQNWAGRISMRFMPPNVALDRNDAAAMVEMILKLDTTVEIDDRFRRHEVMMTMATISGCFACHQVNALHDSRYMPLAPAFDAIAERYRSQPKAPEFLSHRIIDGTRSIGKQWPDTNMDFMPPNVALAPARARELAEWIMTIR